jgi:hypothetical protein
VMTLLRQLDCDAMLLSSHSGDDAAEKWLGS